MSLTHIASYLWEVLIMNRLIIYGLAIAIALVGSASARTFYRYMSPATSSQTIGVGMVGSTGKILRGAAFTVQHPEEGQYVITFNQGFFPTGCASMVANSWAYVSYKAVVAETFVSGCSSNPVFHVFLRRSQDGIPMDRDFQFIAVGV
jgi:hypothetical protein